jgi:putative oxidoreductase
MKKLLRILQLNFLPHSADAGLLVLRLWLGLSLLLLHGKAKLLDFADLSQKFPDPLGIGSTASLALAVFAELVCSGLLALGLVSRFAALSAAFAMGVAFFIVHKASLEMGPRSGELAFIYLAGFVTLVIAGPGCLSLDACLQRTRAAEKGPAA